MANLPRQSLPEWLVLDVAYGDPNNNGHFEALLAWKSGTPKGHPQPSLHHRLPRRYLPPGLGRHRRL